MPRAPVHDWYSTVMGFSPGQIRPLLGSLGVGTSASFLDPFCGAGTALVEAQRLGAEAYGMDANPVAVLASRAKTHPRYRSANLMARLHEVVDEAGVTSRHREVSDPRLGAFTELGLLRRGWLGSGSARSLVRVARAIERVCARGSTRDFFTLALMRAAVRECAHVRFGPEIYVSRREHVPGARRSFAGCALDMIASLPASPAQVRPTRVVKGDARDLCDLRRALGGRKGRAQVECVLTSPPYPNEHDYTRLTRIELILGGFVRCASDIRRLKEGMLRSNTKNVYAHDSDYALVRDIDYVRRRVSEIERRVAGRTDGFARLYPRVVGEYFGGMARVLTHIERLLAPGGTCAIIVGDQATYCGVRVDCVTGLTAVAATCTPRLRVAGELMVRKRTNRNGLEISERALVLRSRSTQV